MRVTSSFSLSLLAPLTQAKWPTVDEAILRDAIDTNEHTLVAYISVCIPVPFFLSVAADYFLDQRQLSKEHINDIAPFQNRRKLIISSGTYANLEKEWSTVKSLAEADTLLTVDCSKTAKLCREYDIVSFPTIRLHQNDGTFERYRGQRKAKDIQVYLERMRRPPISAVNEKNITSFARTDDIVFIGQFSDGDRVLEELYKDVAYQYRDRYSFAIGPVATQSSSLQCINNANQEQFSTSQFSNPSAIENFVKQCARPLVPELTRRNEAEYMRVGKSIVHYFVSADEDRDAYVTDIKPLAKKFRDYLIFATTDVSQYPEMPAAMGHQVASTKVLAVSSPSTGGVYPYRGNKNLTSAVVEDFLNDISAGKVKPWDGMPTAEDGEIRHEEL